MNLKNLNIDNTWTLFLDRDGVINERLVDDYIKNLDEFRFLPGVLNALKYFSAVFGKIFIVTNQQGIGKGLMTESDLGNIHRHLVSEVKSHGGIIDKIYHSPYLAVDNDISRKPNPGLAYQAKKDYPEIDFTRSVMVGDSLSDMEFGRKLRMTNVFISRDKQIISSTEEMFDLCFESLFEFSQYLCS